MAMNCPYCNYNVITFAKSSHIMRALRYYYPYTLMRCGLCRKRFHRMKKPGGLLISLILLSIILAFTGNTVYSLILYMNGYINDVEDYKPLFKNIDDTINTCGI